MESKGRRKRTKLESSGKVLDNRVCDPRALEGRGLNWGGGASWLCVRPALRLRAARVFERGPRRRDGKGEDEGCPSITSEYWCACVG